MYKLRFLALTYYTYNDIVLPNKNHVMRSRKYKSIQDENYSCLIQIIFNPVYVFSDTRIYSRISWFSTFITKRDNTDLNPFTICSKHKWTTGITLTSIFAALTITSAKKITGNWLKISCVAIFVSPYWKHCLPLYRAFFSTY